MYMYVESQVQRAFCGALRSSKLHHITLLGIIHRALQIATENDVTSCLIIIIALQMDCRMQMQHVRYRIFLLLSACAYISTGRK